MKLARPDYPGDEIPIEADEFHSTALGGISCDARAPGAASRASPSLFAPIPSIPNPINPIPSMAAVCGCSSSELGQIECAAETGEERWPATGWLVQHHAAAKRAPGATPLLREFHGHRQLRQLRL